MKYLSFYLFTNEWKKNMNYNNSMANHLADYSLLVFSRAVRPVRDTVRIKVIIIFRTTFKTSFNKRRR